MNKCYLCSNTGLVKYKTTVAELGDTLYEYVARCNCEYSKKYANIPQIQPVEKILTEREIYGIKQKNINAKKNCTIVLKQKQN